MLHSAIIAVTLSKVGIGSESVVTNRSRGSNCVDQSETWKLSFFPSLVTLTNI